MLKYIKIRFISPFRVGRSSLLDTFDYVPSDTIYGGLEYLRAMGVDHGVRYVSSAYPVLGKRPTLPVTPRQIEWLRRSKETKKIRFLPVDCWNDLRVDGEKVLKCRDGGYDVAELRSWGREVEYFRNRVSRHVQNADPYKVVGFLPTVDYVIYYLGDEEKVVKAFKILGEVGVGGERSVGFGRFVVVDSGPLRELENVRAGENCEVLVVLGVARPSRDVEAFGQWEVRHWWCGGCKLLPTTVLLDGGEVRGGPSFNDYTVERCNCKKRLTPLWVCV